MTQQRRHFFLDVDDDMSLPQIFAEARILTLQLLHFFRHGIALGLRPTLLRSQGLPDSMGPLSPPIGQQRGVQTFATEKGADPRRVWRQPPPLAAGRAVCILRCSSAAWVGPPLRGQDARPAGRRQGLSLHCAAARYARLRCVPRQPLPPPTQHQKNSRSYLLSSSPCSLIKTTGGVSEMLARRG